MFIPPMLLEKSDEPFNDPTFLFEPKIDGHRLIMSFKNGETMKGHDNGAANKPAQLIETAKKGQPELTG
jgi:DNA ligase-1